MDANAGGQESKRTAFLSGIALAALGALKFVIMNLKLNQLAQYVFFSNNIQLLGYRHAKKG